MNGTILKWYEGYDNPNRPMQLFDNLYGLKANQFNQMNIDCICVHFINYVHYTDKSINPFPHIDAF